VLTIIRQPKTRGTSSGPPLRHELRMHSPAQVHNDPFSPESEAGVCEKVMGRRHHGLNPIVWESNE